MADHVLEIPLPGRTFCGSTADSPLAAAPLTVSAFIAGPENQLLAGAIDRWLPPTELAVDEQPADEQPADAIATLPTVLAIHGPGGTGKTHLIRGLVRAWRDRYGAESAEYFTATEFRQAMIDAIKQETVAEFRDRVRGRLLLAIDDLDRLPNDDYLQQELRSTIDAYEEKGGRLIVASARAVGSLRNLAPDVRSRLAAGLIVPATPPDVAARKRLVLLASALVGRRLTDDAAEHLADAVSGTANEVFAALLELRATTSGRGQCDVPQVEQYLARRRARRPSMRVILQRVAKFYRLSQQVLKSSSRRQSVVLARGIAVYLGRELGGLSYERIGRALGGRDHSTIMHSYRKIAHAVGCDAATRGAIDELRNLLRNL